MTDKDKSYSDDIYHAQVQIHRQMFYGDEKSRLMYLLFSLNIKSANPFIDANFYQYIGLAAQLSSK